MYPVPVMPVLFCTAVAELSGCAEPEDCPVGLLTGNTHWTLIEMNQYPFFLPSWKIVPFLQICDIIAT